MASQVPIGIKTLVYLLIVTQSVAATLSFLIVFALSIPLFIQLKNGTFRQSAAQLQRRGQEPPYSTYNVYLVYLALVDLAYLLPSMAAEFCTLTPNVCNPGFWSGMAGYVHPSPPNNSDNDDNRQIEGIINLPYAVANLWINAVIAYEVWLLLKATRRRRRINQPSLTRVNLQGGCVIFGSMLCGVFQYCLFSKTDFSETYVLDTYNTIIFALYGLLAGVPFYYVVGVTIFVKCRGYMPAANGSTPRDRAVRGLALYFFRVVTVFLSIWIPVGVCAQIALRFPENRDYLFLATNLFVALQPILTFWMILSKPDVNKYIKDFVSLTYLPGSRTCCRRDGTIDGAEDVESADGQSRRRKSVTILGYNFDNEEVDGSDDAIGDTFVSSNDDAEDEEQEADAENNATVEDCSVDDDSSMDDGDANNEIENHTAGEGMDGESGGNLQYKSRRIRKGSPVRILPTGEVCHIPVK